MRASVDIAAGRDNMDGIIANRKTGARRAASDMWH